jgi:hypothetical protein
MMSLKMVLPLLLLISCYVLPFQKASAQIESGDCAPILQNAFAAEGQLFIYDRWQAFGTGIQAGYRS